MSDTINSNPDEFFIDNYFIRKKQMTNILDSYHNYWDVLAELLQNSVDGLYRKYDSYNGKGEITITINAQNKTINVKDDGIGISDKKLREDLNPNSTEKILSSGEVGGKGVGLTFVAFQCNDFKIKTKYMGEDFTNYTNIKNAYKWCTNLEDKSFIYDPLLKQEEFVGTEISISDCCPERINKLFDLSLDQLIFLLRTKTAIGNVHSIFNKDKLDLKVKLIFIDKTGKKREKNINYEYMLPITKNNDILNIDDAISFVDDNSNSEADKKDYLYERTLVDINQVTLDGVTYDYWACYHFTRPEWENVNSFYRLNTADDSSYPRFAPGLTLSTKGMPTAVDITIPSGLGESGRTNNIFMIINDDAYIPDIGRKSVSNKQSIYQKIYKEFYNKIMHIKAYLIQEDVEDNKYDLSVIKEEIKNSVKLKSKIIKYKLSPSDSEAAVVAIFHELVGTKKVFIEFEPYESRYKNRYDLYGKYNGDFIGVEFKSKLQNLIRDLKNGRKLVDEINYLVCYGVSDDEIKQFNNIGFKVQSVEFGKKSRQKYMPETTHTLSYHEYSRPVYIIDLKIVLDALNKDESIFTKRK